MTERIYSLRLTYGQWQTLMVAVDNERTTLTLARGRGAQECRQRLNDLTELLLAAAKETA